MTMNDTCAAARAAHEIRRRRDPLVDRGPVHGQPVADGIEQPHGRLRERAVPLRPDVEQQVAGAGGAHDQGADDLLRALPSVIGRVPSPTPPRAAGGPGLAPAYGVITCAPSRLSLHCFSWPADGEIRLGFLDSRATGGRLLAGGEPVDVSQRDDVLTVRGLLDDALDQLDTV